MVIEMEYRTVVITGANGYFGGIACKYFEDKGWHVLKATRQIGDDIFFDLNQSDKIINTKINQKVDLFIHAAAAHEIACREQPYKSIYQNVLGTRAALDFCVENNIKNFIYLSTFHVYSFPVGTINEQTIPSPRNDYGLSHLQAEQYVQMYTQNGKINGTVIRPSNFFGIPSSITDCKRWSLIPLAFCREAIETGKIILKTPGFQKRNFIEVQDICSVIESVYPLIEEVPLLHINGEDDLSVRDLAYLIQTTMRTEYSKYIEIVCPSGSNVERDYKYESLYLSDIYLPKGEIDSFVKSFLQCLWKRMKICE